MLRLKYFIILIILILPAVVASEEGEIDTLDAAYCKNGAVTQNDVNLLLSSLNDQRTKLAKGLQSNGNDEDSVLPPAKNMKKLAYDCDLERKAKLFLDSLDCDNTLSKKPDKGYFYYGDSTGNDLRASDNEDLPCLLRVQSKRINKYGFSSFKTNEPVEYTDDDEKLLFYANLMRAKASKIGCTVRTCPPDKAEVLQYLCFTDQKNIQIREQIYEVGTGENCECDEPMTCEGSLCVTAKFPGPSTADEDEEEPEDHEDEDKDEEEPEDYGFEGEPKEPSTKCTSQEISDTMRMRMQKIHNRLRSQLALGQVKINKRRTLPTASNINYLVWDCALEREAHDFLRSCPEKGYQRPDNDSSPAQNFYRAPIASLSTYRDMNEKTVTEWWKPVRKVKGLAANNYFRSKHKRAAIRSYTLMGWASTREMGCSIAKCGEDWVEACRYYPPGNKVNTKMYETGTPCSGCNKLEPCDTGFGLCGSEE